MKEAWNESDFGPRDKINSLKPNDNSSLKPISIPFTGGHIGYERERVAQQGFILLFFDFFSYFQMSFLFITGLISKER